MKKVLLFGFILAVLLLAFPQGVLAADSSPERGVAVTATISDYIDLTVAESATGVTWPLLYDADDYGSDLGANELSPALTFDVSSNNKWKLFVTGDNEGYLNNGGSGGVNLNQRIQVGPDDVGPESYVTTQTKTLLKTVTMAEIGAYPQFTKNLRQQLVIGDDATKQYTITLTFVADTYV